MQHASSLPSVASVVDGKAVFRDDMPVWLGVFGADLWPFIEQTSPLFTGQSSSSFVWRDYIVGKGGTLNHPSSFSKSKYEFCLTPEIISDLKVAAVIHGYYPKLVKDARSSKVQIDPKTVKGRIDELARFFSMIISEGRRKLGFNITRLDQIPFSLLKEVVPNYPGRSDHLKRALKLISDPMVQKNLSAPLQWRLLDITKASIAWRKTKDGVGIPPLSEPQFLFLLDYCKKAVANFKRLIGVAIHDSECQSLVPEYNDAELETFRMALDAYLDGRTHDPNRHTFKRELGIPASQVTDLIRDAHASAMMLILLFTGMRSSETQFLMRGCLYFEHGYWFLKSKEVKHQPKDTPISEGWLAIDIVRDAYDILSFFCSITNNPYLYSSPFPGFANEDMGYRAGALNIKFSRWFKRIDVKGIFAGWTFSIHQCRETLVAQLAKQEVGMPFISMQLKHFHTQFSVMPNAVTAGYGRYRSQLMVSITNRIAGARESALLDVYGEGAKFAGGGGEVHKARIDAFFAGLGLFGEGRDQYIKAMARRGVKLMPTSIGSCTKNFFVSNEKSQLPPCYGDFQCDPDCSNHVITDRSSKALEARKRHALAEAENEANPAYKVIWMGLADKLNGHIKKFNNEGV